MVIALWVPYRRGSRQQVTPDDGVQGSSKRLFLGCFLIEPLIVAKLEPRLDAEARGQELTCRESSATSQGQLD
jgi:hypothetical protein